MSVLKYTSEGQSKLNNPEKLATQGTQDKEKQSKNTTQYVLNTTIHKSQDEDKQNKIHNTICGGHHHTQDTRQRKTQHNMWWTPPYTRHKTKKNTTQYVVDTTLCKQTQIT
jgi:hypothetical protein